MKSAKENMCLLWLSKELDISLELACDNKEELKNTLMYSRLELRYALAPLVLPIKKYIAKINNYIISLTKSVKN